VKPWVIVSQECQQEDSVVKCSKLEESLEGYRQKNNDYSEQLAALDIQLAKTQEALVSVTSEVRTGTSLAILGFISHYLFPPFTCLTTNKCLLYCSKQQYI